MAAFTLKEQKGSHSEVGRLQKHINIRPGRRSSWYNICLGLGLEKAQSSQSKDDITSALCGDCEGHLSTVNSLPC